ncbi:hypothetical protein [Actinopolymorpha pittospori]|uniref:Uncharacterized protein n=1 Tax=Actinopolymorpha pittospori TaxID=648752 RepID=A0A927MW12_9ACTN|nr:hypothetical protein [Actinopolymorpha pittospori]MBE1604347.1 hypothetical protein [Actinopolymorpha pittospori]
MQTTHRDRLEVTVGTADVEALRALRTDIFSVINESTGAAKGRMFRNR